MYLYVYLLVHAFIIILITYKSDILRKYMYDFNDIMNDYSI